MAEKHKAAEDGLLADTRRGPAVPAWIYAPSGRMGRADFFYAILARVFAIYLIGLAFAFVAVSAGWIVRNDLFDAFSAMPLYLVAFVASGAGPVVRRLHDIDLSGVHSIWLCFALVLSEILVRSQKGNVPVLIIGALPYLVALALMLRPGTQGPNRYGSPPT